MIEGAITCTSTGANIAYTGTSSVVAIPNNSSGNRPNYCRLAATGACYVKLGGATVTAVVGDLLIQNADSVLIRTRDFTHVAAIQHAAGGSLNIAPLDDM
jgi:hypothetical protein